MSKVNNKLPSDILRGIADGSDRVTLFDIKTYLQGHSFGILIILFSLPSSIPIPVPPGYTTILSIPLILFSLQFLLGFSSPWMPRWLERKSFKRSTLALVAEKAYPILRRIEKLMKPRMFFIFYGPAKGILAFIMFLCALSIAVPLPFIHFIPATGLTLISLGIMGKDGFLSILGVLISLCGLLLSVMVITKGPQLMLEAFSLLKSFL